MAGLLDGLVVPLVTPMSEPGLPSADAGEPLLRAMARAGVRRLMLLGSNGEGPLIPVDRAGAFVAGVTSRWRDLVPGGSILVNVTAAGTDEARRRAEDAAAAGVDALVLSPPTYFRHRDDEVVAHYAAMAGQALPVVAYNAPRYATPLTPAIVAALADLPHVVGIKDSSGDPDLLTQLIAAARRRPGFQVSQGDERHLAGALRAGAHGITPGTANLAPRLALDLVTARDNGAELDRLQDLTTRLTHIHAVRPGVPSVKALLAMRGLCPPHSAPPLAPCTSDEIEELARVVEPLTPHLLTDPGSTT
ncbi:dihydrodipicolinate synthase family protein [Nonomuraea sp. NPDC049709]|uniref:dihydrodipicolinate synthase family protein n=1 Tax=Nonomuraea sp. NPDC049709 TaxID=3154736 RepID=UPI00341D7490